MADLLKTPPTLFLPDIEDIEDEKIKRVCEGYNKAIEELVTDVYSDVSWLYERLTVKEGTWTMGVSFGGGTTGITYGQNTGYYTKIGNLVTISGVLVLTSKGTSTGQALVTGLPFTVVNNIAAQAVLPVMLIRITFADVWIARVNPNDTTIYLADITNAGVESALTNADFTHDSIVVVGGTYRCQ